MTKLLYKFQLQTSSVSISNYFPPPLPNYRSNEGGIINTTYLIFFKKYHENTWGDYVFGKSSWWSKINSDKSFKKEKRITSETFICVKILLEVKASLFTKSTIWYEAVTCARMPHALAWPACLRPNFLKIKKLRRGAIIRGAIVGDTDW